MRYRLKSDPAVGCCALPIDRPEGTTPWMNVVFKDDQLHEFVLQIPTFLFNATWEPVPAVEEKPADERLTIASLLDEIIDISAANDVLDAVRREISNAIEPGSDLSPCEIIDEIVRLNTENDKLRETADYLRGTIDIYEKSPADIRSVDGCVSRAELDRVASLLESEIIDLHILAERPGVAAIDKERFALKAKSYSIAANRLRTIPLEPKETP